MLLSEGGSQVQSGDAFVIDSVRSVGATHEVGAAAAAQKLSNQV